MGWYKDLYSVKSFMASALHVSAKGLHVILKRMRCYSREGRGIFRKNILTYNILQRGILQAQHQVEENAVVMTKDCNQSSIIEI